MNRSSLKPLSVRLLHHRWQTCQALYKRINRRQHQLPWVFGEPRWRLNFSQLLTQPTCVSSRWNWMKSSAPHCEGTWRGQKSIWIFWGKRVTGTSKSRIRGSQECKVAIWCWCAIVSTYGWIYVCAPFHSLVFYLLTWKGTSFTSAFKWVDGKVVLQPTILTQAASKYELKGEYVIPKTAAEVVKSGMSNSRDESTQPLGEESEDKSRDSDEILVR